MAREHITDEMALRQERRELISKSMSLRAQIYQATARLNRMDARIAAIDIELARGRK